MEIIQIISSVIIAIATMIYVLLTNKILKTNQRFILEQTRPYIVADLIVKDTNLYFRLRNYGARGAYSVKCETVPDLRELEQKVSESIIGEILNQEYISPNFEILYYLNKASNFVQKSIKITVKIHYKDNLSVYYEEENSLRFDGRLFYRNLFGERLG
jgi:hypothetical protein